MTSKGRTEGVSTSLGNDLGARPPMKRRNLRRAGSSLCGHRGFRALFFPPVGTPPRACCERAADAPPEMNCGRRGRARPRRSTVSTPGPEPPASIIVSESRMAQASPPRRCAEVHKAANYPELNARRRGVRLAGVGTPPAPYTCSRPNLSRIWWPMPLHPIVTFHAFMPGSLLSLKLFSCGGRLCQAAAPTTLALCHLARRGSSVHHLLGNRLSRPRRAWRHSMASR